MLPLKTDGRLSAWSIELPAHKTRGDFAVCKEIVSHLRCPCHLPSAIDVDLVDDIERRIRVANSLGDTKVAEDNPLFADRIHRGPCEAESEEDCRSTSACHRAAFVASQAPIAAAGRCRPFVALLRPYIVKVTSDRRPKEPHASRTYE